MLERWPATLRDSGQSSGPGFMAAVSTSVWDLISSAGDDRDTVPALVRGRQGAAHGRARADCACPQGLRHPRHQDRTPSEELSLNESDPSLRSIPSVSTTTPRLDQFASPVGRQARDHSDQCCSVKSTTGTSQTASVNARAALGERRGPWHNASPPIRPAVPPSDPST